MEARAPHPPPTRLERAAWCAFDFANSSFTTIMVTVVYPPYLASLARNKDEGDILWAWAMGGSLAIALVLSPLVGALADQQARKKAYLAFTWLLCVVFCAACSFFGKEAFALAAFSFVVANIGFSLGENLIAAFLPELATPDQMGRLSGLGWSVGYFGGLASLAVALPLVSANEARWVPLATAGFFLLAGLPTLLLLRERAHPKPETGRAAMADALRQLRDTFAQRRSYPDLFRFLIALFLEQAGVAVVIMFAAIYAKKELKLTDAENVQLFIGLQIAAALGAAGFGFVQDKIGGKRALILTIVVWLVAVGVTLLSTTIPAFSVGAGLAGVAMGSSQASGRAMVGVFTPPNRQGEWFGLWGIAMKAAGVLGVAGYALVRVSGFSMRAGMWSTAVFFVLSLLVLAKVDERRGRRRAAEAS